MLTEDKKLYIAHCDDGQLNIIGKMANRHGLIAGATGTGKTVTLQVLAETFGQAGVPCFMADMKGDLSGISQPGKMSGFIEKRKDEFGVADPKFQACPVRFFDVFGQQGHPIRVTISSMGPQMLSRLMGLNDTQTGVLNIVFKVADDRGLLLLDLKDLKSMLNYVGKNASQLTTEYGNVSAASVGAIQRQLLELEKQGADLFFGEPEFDIKDLLQTENGKGIMNVLAADKLMLQPKLYSTFLLWLISSLYAQLPEVGDQELPKLVFFFDEAHTLFTDTPKALTEKIEQVIRLIRSKGVGIYFVTQSPTDIPENILGQLGNRIQHALRAYTPKDQKAVKTAADTFRANPAFKTADAITSLETGEALVSLLDEKGAPTMVQKAKILFPLSQIGAITEGQRLDIVNGSALKGKYDTMIDRESAFEILLAESEKLAKEQEEEKAAKEEEKAQKAAAKTEKKSSTGGSVGDKVLKGVVTAATGSVASAVGKSVSKAITGKSSGVINTATTSIFRTIVRSILGNLIK